MTEDTIGVLEALRSLVGTVETMNSSMRTMFDRISSLEREVRELQSQFSTSQDKIVDIVTLQTMSDLDGVWCDCESSKAHTVGEHLDQIMPYRDMSLLESKPS